MATITFKIVPLYSNTLHPVHFHYWNAFWKSCSWSMSNTTCNLCSISSTVSKWQSLSLIFIFKRRSCRVPNLVNRADEKWWSYVAAQKRQWLQWFTSKCIVMMEHPVAFVPQFVFFYAQCPPTDVSDHCSKIYHWCSETDSWCTTPWMSKKMMNMLFIMFLTCFMILVLEMLGSFTERLLFSLWVITIDPSLIPDNDGHQH